MVPIPIGLILDLSIRYVAPSTMPFNSSQIFHRNVNVWQVSQMWSSEQFFIYTDITMRNSKMIRLGALIFSSFCSSFFLDILPLHVVCFCFMSILSTNKHNEDQISHLDFLHPLPLKFFWPHHLLLTCPLKESCA